LIYHKKSIKEFYADSIIGVKGNRIDISNQLEGIGITFQYLGLYDSALIYFDSSMMIRKKINDILGSAMCHDGIADVYRIWGKFSYAVLHLDSGLAIKKDYLENYQNIYGGKINPARFEGTRESNSISLLYFGKLYLGWNKPEQAIQYLEESLEIWRQIDYNRGKAEVFVEMGNAFRQQKNYTEARLVYDSALVIYCASGGKPGEAQVLHKIGNLQFIQGQFRDAEANYRNAAMVFEELDLKQQKATIYKDLGLLYREQGRTQKAMEYLEKSYHLSGLLNFERITKTVANALADIYRKQTNYPKAYEMIEHYNLLRNSLYNKDSHKLVAEVAAHYDLERRETQIALLSSEQAIKDIRLRQSNYYLVGLFVFLLLLILVTMLMIRQLKLRSMQKSLLLEQKLLRTQNESCIFV